MSAPLRSACLGKRRRIVMNNVDNVTKAMPQDQDESVANRLELTRISGAIHKRGETAVAFQSDGIAGLMHKATVRVQQPVVRSLLMEHYPYREPDGLLARMIHDASAARCGYAAATGSLAVQPFDILHEYASGLHVSECPSRFASAHVRDEPSGIMRARVEAIDRLDWFPPNREPCGPSEAGHEW